MEDFDKPSANIFARSIRQIMYSILFKHIDKKTMIYEYDRSLQVDGKCQIEEHQISLKAEVNDTSIPSLSEVKDMDNPGQFMRLALGLDPIFQSDSDIQLVLLAMAFWKKNSYLNIKNVHIHAIFLSMINLALEDMENDKVIKSSNIFGYAISEPQCMEMAGHRLSRYYEKSIKSTDLSIVHAFAEFQSILRAVMNLNEFLQCPFQPICPSKVYNGVFLYNIFCELKSKKDLNLFICELLGTLSDDLKDLINLLDAISDKTDRRDEDHLNSEEASNTDGWQKVIYKKRNRMKQSKLNSPSDDGKQIRALTNFLDTISERKNENGSCIERACGTSEFQQVINKK